MTIGRVMLRGLNRLLAPANLALETLTAERDESARLAALDAAGHFAGPVFPVLRGFAACDPAPVVAGLAHYREQTARFVRPPSADAYSFHNDYFPSPDGEVAYALLRNLKPRTIIEIGSGNSTLLFREAIRDGGLPTRLVSVDPTPRRPIAHAADEVVALRAENLSIDFFQERLEPGDFLFIDSSHRVDTGGDVLKIALTILPSLPAGTLVHFHDVFLPYDYPRGWVVDHRWGFGEQYLIQAMLQESGRYEVAWPGYYLQRTLEGFGGHFHLPQSGNAASLWLRKLG